MQQKRGVIFIVQKPDKSLLLQQRDENSDELPLSWVFPGGRSKDDESFTETVKREIFEEYEIIINGHEMTLLAHFPHKQNAVYLCSVTQDCKPIMHEGKSMRWVTKEELKKVELGYNQEKLIPLIEKKFMKITKFEQSNFEALEILKTKSWSVADKEHYGEVLPNFFKEEFTLIAQENEEIFGYITVICDSGVAQIEPLMVDPDKKGQGIGTALLQEAEKLAKEEGIHKLWLETGGNWKAKEFYLKHGYTIRTELPNHTGGQTFVLMDKLI